jgi:hypothetical protein
VLIDVLIVLGLVALTAAVPRLINRHRRRVRWRAVENAKPVAIGALSPGGLARITGAIEPRGALLKSPIGLEPCIGYSTVIEALGYGTWRIVMNSMKSASFYVTDETGTAIVDKSVLIVHPPDAAWETPPASAWPTTGDEQVRCLEVLLKPGDRVSVLGRVTMELDPAGRGSYRELPMLPCMKGSAGERVHVAHTDATPVD